MRYEASNCQPGLLVWRMGRLGMGSHNALGDGVGLLLRNIWDRGGMGFQQPLPGIMIMGIVADSGVALRDRASGTKLLSLVVSQVTTDEDRAKLG